MSKTEKLLEIIHKLIQKEVNRQMLTLKQQILYELKHTNKQSASINVSAPKQPVKSRSINRPNIQYSTNPVLNEILRSTSPMENDSPQMVLDHSGRPVNFVAQDSNGRPVNFENPNVQGVLEAMNRNYSDMIEPVKPVKKSPVPHTPTLSNFKQSALSSIISDSPDDDLNGLHIPDPFSENQW